MTTPAVLFVCFGNICRSPSAQGILAHKLSRIVNGSSVIVDSCGTAAINLGNAPDPRAIAAAKALGYDISDQRARQIDDVDYDTFSHIIAMDRKNLSQVKTWAPANHSASISLIMDFLPGTSGNLELLDPYYGSQNDFSAMFPQLERCIDGLLDRLVADYTLEKKP